ncbi:MAG: DinB family protein [Candidatus Dormibacterales bacterium]
MPAGLPLPFEPPPRAGVGELRAAFERLCGLALTVPDGALERPWPWRGDELDVRFGLYHVGESLGELTATLAALGGGGATAALARQLGLARWDLHGLLLPLTDAELDLEPAGEWPLRTVVAHAIEAQGWWTWLLSEWVSEARRGLPIEGHGPDRAPPRDGAGEGSLAVLRARADAWIDAALGCLPEIEARGLLGAPVTWWDLPVTAGFYPQRMAAHLLEHTLQADKTLVLLGRRPSEVERIVRRLCGAYALLEAACTEASAAAALATMAEQEKAAGELASIAAAQA